MTKFCCWNVTFWFIIKGELWYLSASQKMKSPVQHQWPEREKNPTQPSLYVCLYHIFTVIHCILSQSWVSCSVSKHILNLASVVALDSLTEVNRSSKRTPCWSNFFKILYLDTFQSLKGWEIEFRLKSATVFFWRLRSQMKKLTSQQLVMESGLLRGFWQKLRAISLNI